MARRKNYDLPKGEGSFYQRSNGLWVGSIVVGVKEDGKPRRVSVSSMDKDTAWDRLTDRRKDLILNGAPNEGIRDSERLSHWIDTWLDARAGRVRPNTFLTERTLLTNWVRPIIGHRPIKEIGPADMRALTQSMMRPREITRRDGTKRMKAGLSSTTAHYAQRLLQQVLREAIAEGYTVSPRALVAPKPLNAVSDRRALTFDQVEAILRVIADRPDRSIWIAALLQGMRRGEILGLTWGCVHLDDSVLDVSWQLQELTRDPDNPSGYLKPPFYETRHLARAFHLTRPKSKAGKRIIPLVPWMRTELIRWREVAPTSPYDLVWARDAGPRSRMGDPLRPDVLLAAWKDIQKTAGVQKGTRADGSPIYFVLHEARHTAASLLLAAGVDPEIVKAIMGHSEVVTTQGYQHADRTMAMKALESVADMIQLPVA